VAGGDLFHEENGHREDTKSILILITDGKQNPKLDKTMNIKLDPAIAAGSLKKKGIEIFAVGVGTNVDKAELEAITGDSKKVYHASTFDKLISDEFVGDVSKKICHYRPPPTTTPPPTTQPSVVKTFETQPAARLSPTTKDLTNAIVPSVAKINPDAKSSLNTKVMLDIQKSTPPSEMPLASILKLGSILPPVTTAPPDVQKPPSANNVTVDSQKKPVDGRNPPAVTIDKEFDLSADDAGVNPLNRVERTLQRNVGESDQEACNRGNGTKNSNACCGCCCGQNVYINIFNQGAVANMGPQYFFQGARLDQDKGAARVSELLTSSTRIDLANGMDNKKLRTLLQKCLPYNKDLVSTLETFIHQHKSAVSASSENVTPANMPSRTKRSVHSKMNGVINFHKLLKVGSLSGCGKFIEALEKYGITAEIDRYLRQHKKIAFFCPVDGALKSMNIYPSGRVEKIKMRNKLRHQVAIMQDLHGTIYRSLLTNDHIALHPRHDANNTVSWMAEDSHIIFSFSYGKYGEMFIIDNLLTPPLSPMKQVVRNHSKLTTMYSLLQKIGNLSSLLKSSNIEKICFQKDLCVPLDTESKQRIQQALRFNQYTFIAPSDAVFDKIKKQEYSALLSVQEKRIEFLRRHLFLGILNKHSLTTKMNIIAQPIDVNDSVAVVHGNNSATMVTMGDGQTYRLTEAVRVKEGMLIVQEVV